MNSLRWLLSLWLLCCLAVPAQGQVALPDILAQRIGQDGLVVGDFDWLRGAFPDATAEEAAHWGTLGHWLDDRKAANRDRVIAELAALGVEPTGIEPDCFGEEPCAMAAVATALTEQFDSWEAFTTAFAEARPYFDTYVFATEMAEQAASARAGAPLAERLIAATVGEQTLRYAAGWGSGIAAGAPAMSDGALTVLRALLWIETSKRDRANLAMLRREVEERGWPRISDVGPSASFAAWLLVQHADTDRAFQLRSLRLMEPLVAEDDVSSRNFAYLYDRVMLPITGRQRYGTQFHCVDDRVQPRPMEDADNIDAIRATVGLDSFEDYRAQMEEMFGTNCG